MIRAIHHVQITIPAGQEDIARSFYCGLLGLLEIEKPNSLRHRGGFWLQVGHQAVHVGTENDVDRNATKAHIAYEVDELVQWRERLSAAGFTPLEGIPIPGVERFECRDPFGNRFELVQPIASARNE
ncbi:MAG: VOC family protein [Anaerolineae bacterium]